MSAAPSATFAQTVDVETPELVVLTYTVAGVGSRVAAALIDYAICLLGYGAVLIGLASLGARGAIGGGARSAAWAGALLYLLLFAILWGYYVLFEGLGDGQTPGKRLLRLRAVRDGGYSVTFGASAVRNLVRLVDMMVPSGGEVEWILPQGRLPYWRGRAVVVNYDVGPDPKD